MKKIVHISDLHFGTENSKIVNHLIDDINEIKPDVIVVSGDLTQRAKTKEYSKAKIFLKNLDYHTVVIPGNHDIPLYNIWGRIVHPFKKFETYFDHIDRYYSDDILEIIGLNSVRNLRWKSGKLSSEQLEIGAAEVKKSGKNIIRILVIHHNLFHISSRRDAVKLFKTKRLHHWLMQNNIDIILFGHDHKSMVQPILFDDDKIFDFILIQAGTATSNRTRGFPNSYNVIEISDDDCKIKIREYKNQKFEIISEQQFVKVSAGWKYS
jgi:3',5'-cyclic AMP phosphodiesterase CpdA